MILYRLIVGNFGSTPVEAIGGRGGILGQGRWHTPGRPIVYTSQSISLAMAEALVHLKRAYTVTPSYRWTIDVPDEAIDQVPKLPEAWRRDPNITQAVGNKWLAAKSSAGLRVPSALVPEEYNVLLNPLHPEFSFKWIKAGPIPFSFDPRLTGP